MKVNKKILLKVYSWNKNLNLVSLKPVEQFPPTPSFNEI